MSLIDAPGLYGAATFALPSSIDADQPLRTSEAARQMLADVIAQCRPSSAGASMKYVDDSALYALAIRCEALLGGRRANDAHEDRSPLTEDEQSFDRFFGLRRNRSQDAFVVGIASGLVSLLYELNRPHTLGAAELAALMSGFDCLAHTFAPRISSAPQPRYAPGGLSGPPCAVGRWRNGHLGFIALVGGLLFTHARAIAAVRQRQVDRAAQALHDAGCLFRASAAAMQLTGDMTPHDYDAIRTLMAPPHVPPGFSGLFNADHRHLLRLTKTLGALLGGEWPAISGAREAYWGALSDLYAAHRHVCEKLVGASPSLASTSLHSAQPATEKLDAFARRALRFSGHLKASG